MDRSNKLAINVIGLAFGDEGKGCATDVLCRKHGATLCVRYNGGHQAAHAVCLPDGRFHIFSQFGSGTLIDGVKTHLSRFVIINPLSMLKEDEHLRSIGISDAFKRLTVEGRCLVTTPFDRELNIIKEQHRGSGAHGSCGVGIGETKLYHNTYGDEALFAEDLKNRSICRLKLRLKQMRAADVAKSLGQTGRDLLLSNRIIWQIAEDYYKWDDHVFIDSDYSLRLKLQRETAIFEGAQGVLLDEREEFAPYHTWSDCTCKNADTLLEESGFNGEVKRVGCLRAYMTRHGAGPFPTEDQRLSELSEPHNHNDGFQGKFRRGHFDMASVKHALDICGGVDEIHMSHLDQLPKIYGSVGTDSYVSNIERLLETPITVTGHGPTFEDRRERDAKGVVARRRVVKTVSGLSLCTEGKEPEGQSISSGQDEVQNA